MAVAVVAGIAAMGSAAVAAGTLAIGWGAAAAAFAIGAGLSIVSRAIAPKPKLNTGASLAGLTATVREPATSKKIVYGRSRIGGTVVFIDTTGADNKYLHLVIAMAGHEIDAFESVYFNDEKVWEGTYLSGWGGYSRIKFYKGDQTTADSDLVSESTSWTTNHILRDTAYLYVRLEYDPDQFPNGIPNVSAVVRGKKIYDPRQDSTSSFYDASVGVDTHRVNDSSTWTWSQNPALAVRDYLVDTKYGLGEAPGLINESALVSAADYCEIEVDGNLDPIPQLEINGIVDTANSRKENIDSMLSSMGGMLVYSGGSYFIRAAQYVSPTITIDESVMVAQIQIQTRQSRRSQYNGVKGIFLSKEKNYTVADYPAQISSTYATEDGDPIYLDMPLPFVTDNEQAQRLAKIALLKSRQQTVITVPVNLAGLKFKAGDVINITNERLGYDQKPFEVLDYSIVVEGSGTIRVDLRCIETASSIYDWLSSDAQDFLSGGELTLYDGRTTQPPTSLTATESTRINSDGAVIPTIELAWTAASDAFVDHYEVEWKQSTASTYKTVNTVGTEYEIPVPVVGVTYNTRVRAVNSLGVRSSYVTANVTMDGDTTAPATPSGASTSADVHTLIVSWTNPSDLDLSYVEVKRHPSNDEPSATVIAQSDSTSFVDGPFSVAQTYYYWVRAVDNSGNTSAWVSAGSATTTGVLDSDLPDGLVNTSIYRGIVTDDALAPSDSEFSAVAGRNPREHDLAITVDTTTDPDTTYAWEYNGTSWDSIPNLISGNLLVDGSVTANELSADSVFGNQISATTTILAGAGVNSAALSGVYDYRFWAGGETPAINLPFLVHKDGTVYARKMVLKDSSGNELFNSETGFTNLSINQIVAGTGSTGIKVTTYSEAFTDNNGEVEITLSQTSDLKVGIKIDASWEGDDINASQSTAESNAIADIPSQVQLGVGYASSAGGSFVASSTGTFSRVTSLSGTPSDEYLVEATSFYEPEVIPGGAYVASASVQTDEPTSAVGSFGYILYEYTFSSLPAGTYYFRTTTSGTGGSGSNVVNSSYDRTIEITDLTTDGGFIVDGGGSQTVGEADITSVTAGTNLTGGGLSGGVTLNLASTIVGDHTFSDNLTVSGNLTVNGTTTTLNTATLDVEDKNITLNYGAGDTSGSADGAGITIQDAVDASTDATILWDATNDRFDFSHSIAFDGTATTTNQARGIFWTGYDKEGVSDFTDAAYIQHTTNTGGHTGSVLVISSQNDAADGIAFSTHDNSKLRHNGYQIWTAQDFSNNSSDWNTAYTYSQVSHLPLAGGTMTGNVAFDTTNTGITWAMNTDGAYIKFFNTGDSDDDSRLEYATSDNGNEYHRFLIAGTERMKITATGITATGYNKSNWDTAYGWGNHADGGYLTGNESITLSGDASGTGSTSITVTLANTLSPATATELSSTDNLNDFGSGQAGFYYQTANADTPDNNYPSGHAGSLIVQKSAGNATQLYQTYQSDAPRLYFRSAYTSGYGTWQRVFADNYHPNADKLTNARTITLDGDATGNVNFDGSGNVTLTVAVVNDSHTHDGRYYTESESDTRFLRSGADDDFSGKLTATGTAAATALDLATNDQYASMRVIRNAGSSTNDGMYIGYGNAGTGVTRIYGGGSTTSKVQVSSDGSLTADGNVTAYSDQRLKTDIQTLDGSKVYQMRGVSFVKDGKKGSGVIAQELEKVAPELVMDGEFKSVAYGNIVGYLIEAIKELKAEIDELKNG